MARRKKDIAWPHLNDAVGMSNIHFGIRLKIKWNVSGIMTDSRNSILSRKGMFLSQKIINNLKQSEQESSAIVPDCS